MRALFTAISQAARVAHVTKIRMPIRSARVASGLAYLGYVACLACAGASVVTTGCNREKGDVSVTFGEPVGVRVEAPSDPSSFVEAAFALPSGHSPDPLIPAMARALHGATKACPAIVPLTKRGETLHFRGRIEAGLLELDADPTAGAEAQCARAAMIRAPMQSDTAQNGAPIDTKASPLPMVIEIASGASKEKP